MKKNITQTPLRRNMGMQRVMDGMDNPDPPPAHTLDAVPPPEYWSKPPAPETEPMALTRSSVSSAFLVTPSGVSDKEYAKLTPTGGIVHGAFGELDTEKVQGIPLEYLALLGPSAEGAAAVRSMSSEKGTLLVFGASQPAGMSAVQVGAAAGHAVVAVVGGEHSGNDNICDVVKGLTKEPGFMVPEELAMVKKTFQDLVSETLSPPESKLDSDTYLSDFHQNLLDYIATYPDTLPAAVDKEELMFDGKDKDRTYYRENMEAYLSQFPKGASSIPESELLSKFTKEQYALYKQKFGVQTTSVISGESTPDFEPVDLVKQMVHHPESTSDLNSSSFDFSILDKTEIPSDSSGPIVGAIIAVTPYLQQACEAVDAAMSMREKAEALQFLPVPERNAFAAMCSVSGLAKKHGVPTIVVGGSLPGLEGVSVLPEDVDAALSSMDVKEDGSSDLNHFVQVYRAGDFPIYEDYAVHRATEVLAGPRQIVVTK